MHQQNSKLFAIPFLTTLLYWLAFILLLLGAGILSGLFPPGVSRVAYGLTGAAAALLVTYLFLHFQKSSFASIGLTWIRGSVRRFITGVIIGGLTLAVMLYLLHVLAGLDWERNEEVLSSATILSYLTILPLALMEEVAFRAYPFILLQRRYGIWVAQIVTSLAFGLYHISGGNLFSVLLGPGIWGMVFGLAAAWSRGIAMPFGIHVALNAGQLVMGMKGTDDAIWKISESGQVNLAAQFDVNEVGLAMQLAVLLITICLTFLYNKTENNAPSPGYR